MPRKRVVEPDPLASLKVEIHVARGDAALKAEGTAATAPAIIAALTDALDAAMSARPTLLPTVDHVPGDRLDVVDEDAYGYRKRPGFRV